MRLLVSTEKYNYDGYKVVSSLKNIDFAKYDTVIYNNSTDEKFETILLLTKANEFINKIIYINEDINGLYYGFFSGLDADIYNDITLIQDRDTLEYIVDNYKSTGMTIKKATDDVETLSKFVDSVSKENAETLDKLIRNALWIKSLESSVNNVENALVRTNQSNTSMVEMFSKAAEIITDLQESYEKTNSDIEKLRLEIEQKAVLQEPVEKNQSSAFFYSTYKVPNTIPKVLYIRVYSPCKYLNNFIMAYQHYLRMERPSTSGQPFTSKVLLAAPKLKQFLKKYEAIPRLAPETISTINLGSVGDFFVTFEPKPIVLNAFFDMRADLYIVIDMMYGDNLIAGAKVIPLNAITGVSDIARFNLKPQDTIMSFNGVSNSIIIPYIREYNSKTVTESKKRNLYYETCKGVDDKGTAKAYTRLDKLLFV